jgi:hypothetical protein
MNCVLRSTARAPCGYWFQSGRRWVVTLITLALCPSYQCFAAALPNVPKAADMTLSYAPPEVKSFLSFVSWYLPTLVFLAFLVVVAVMFYWFVKVFTFDLNPDNPPDDDARAKVRKMIVFCYVFMLLTLGVAVSPFIFLMALPQGVVSAMYNYMPDSPVALVVGCVHDDRPEDSHWEIVCQPRDPYMNEWLISIGGLVLTIGGGNVIPAAAPASVSTSNASAGPPTDSRQAGPSAVATTPANLKAATHGDRQQGRSRALSEAAPPADPKTSTTGASNGQESAGTPSPPTGVGTPDAAASPGASDFYPPPPWTPDFNLTSGYWNFPPVVIHGGITVPLYFIIVALVGASISLTRRVPEYQKQFLDKEKPFAASEMREQLVLQILQFLSAPFLAIAGYILITPAGPTTSIPLAFVAGFSSETVLKLITSAIENFTKKA